MISASVFGTTKDGVQVNEYTLTNSTGSKVSILDYGCTIRSIVMPDKNCMFIDVCLGYDSVAEYEKGNGCFGAVIGRFANRIKNGRFSLNGDVYQLAVNDGPNHLHGGLRGFDKYVWSGKVADNVLLLTRLSPDGEEGYPGNLQVTVAYNLSDSNALHIRYEATSDKDTIINLTNHTYFNLNGHNSGSVLGHSLKINSDEITENDSQCLPNGKFLSVEGTPFDFRKPKTLGEEIEKDHPQIVNGHGYDHNFVLGSENTLKYVATLAGELSGMKMEVYTDQPGIQLYSGNFISEQRGKSGAFYNARQAICLETQGYPNSTEYAYFPSPVLPKGSRYKTETIFKFI